MQLHRFFTSQKKKEVTKNTDVFKAMVFQRSFFVLSNWSSRTRIEKRAEALFAEFWHWRARRGQSNLVKIILQATAIPSCMHA
jgi:hypothetical protein